MRVIEVTYSNGYCGCDVVEYLAFSHKIPDGEIDSYCQEMLNEYIEQYEYVATGWEEDWESEEDRDSYYENCTFDWIDIDPDAEGIPEEDIFIVD